MKSFIYHTFLSIQVAFTFLFFLAMSPFFAIAGVIWMIDWVWEWSQPKKIIWRFHCRYHEYLSQDEDCPYCKEIEG